MLKEAVKQAIDFAERQGVEVPIKLQIELLRMGIKNAAGLARSVRGAVRRLYNSADISAFIGEMYGYIEAQFTAAWFEGMADNGLNKDDMTEEWVNHLTGLIVAEQAFVYDFGNEIVAAALGTGGSTKPIDPFLARADLWGNRYNEIVNEARIMTAEAGQKLVWVFGDTDHCETCMELNGIVAFASEWSVAGVKPQSAPNDNLQCGGWRCKCSLEPTDQRHTKDAFGKILQAISRK